MSKIELMIDRLRKKVMQCDLPRQKYHLEGKIRKKVRKLKRVQEKKASSYPMQGRVR